MPSWRKINIHLQRYWAREVLGKFPVMQHLRFGKLFAMTWEPTVKQDRRQLEYVNAPKRTEESVNMERRTQSHMAAGYKEEFTAIKSVHCSLCFPINEVLVRLLHKQITSSFCLQPTVLHVSTHMIQMLKELLLNHSPSIMNIDARCLIEATNKPITKEVT